VVAGADRLRAALRARYVQHVRYELVFLRREPGQSWEDAFTQRSEGVEDTGADVGLRRLGRAEIESWDRLITRAEALLGPLEITSEPVVRELLHAETGIELTMSVDEASISVPYDRGGQSAIDVMERVYALARIVEDETGLEGYDIQLEEPFSDAARGIADEASTVTDDPADEARGAGGGSQAERLRHIAEPLREPDARRPAARDTSRRWWEFWRS
jgi:hypothetical protein